MSRETIGVLALLFFSCASAGGRGDLGRPAVAERPGARMGCSTYVVRTTDLNTNRVTLELRCHNRCADGRTPCEEQWLPSDQAGELLRVCYCEDEILPAPPACNPTMVGAGCRQLRTCRAALAYKYRPDGSVEDQPFDIRCTGACPEEKSCQRIERGSTTLEAVRIEIIQCACA